MKRTLGWVFLLLGIGVVCVGLYLALAPVIATYQSAMDDPLRDSPTGAPGSAGNEEDGKALARRMIRGVIIGALGIPLTITGSVLLGVSLIQRLRRRHEQHRRT